MPRHAAILTQNDVKELSGFLSPSLANRLRSTVALAQTASRDHATLSRIRGMLTGGGGGGGGGSTRSGRGPGRPAGRRIGKRKPVDAGALLRALPRDAKSALPLMRLVSRVGARRSAVEYRLKELRGKGKVKMIGTRGTAKYYSA